MSNRYERNGCVAHAHPNWTPPGIAYAPADPSKRRAVRSYVVDLPPKPGKKS